MGSPSQLLPGFPSLDFHWEPSKGPSQGAFSRSLSKEPSRGAFPRSPVEEPSQGALSRTLPKGPSRGAFPRSPLEEPSRGAFPRNPLEEPSQGAFSRTVHRKKYGFFFLENWLQTYIDGRGTDIGTWSLENYCLSFR